jgi:hypothetical protein
MKNKELDSVAAEIYKTCLVNNPSTFKELPDSCKIFYRKIARWHLGHISNVEGITIALLHKYCASIDCGECGLTRYYLRCEFKRSPRYWNESKKGKAYKKKYMRKWYIKHKKGA